jgi:hypothetical protein
MSVPSLKCFRVGVGAHDVGGNWLWVRDTWDDREPQHLRMTTINRCIDTGSSFNGGR